MLCESVGVVQVRVWVGHMLLEVHGHGMHELEHDKLETTHLRVQGDVADRAALSTIKLQAVVAEHGGAHMEGCHGRHTVP